jgi:stage V sporulation protein B
MKNTNKGQTILKGAMVLAIASFLSKVIGMLYRIPMTNAIGNQGNFVYGTAFQIYTILVALSAVGVPSAISKLVSERVAVGAYKDAHRVYKIALCYTGIFSFILAVGLWYSASFIALVAADGRSEVILPIKILAPTVFIVSVMAVMRGYMQGLKTMTPTAISQVVEQVFNAIFSVLLAYMLLPKGVNIAAAGSTLGTGIGGIAGLGVMVFVYIVVRPTLKKRIKKSKPYPYESNVEVLRQILTTTLPIVISTSVFAIISTVDNFMLMHRLPASITHLLENGLADRLPLHITNAESVGINVHLLIEQYTLKYVPIYEQFTRGTHVFLTPLPPSIKNITDELIGQYTGKYMPLVNVPVSLILTLAMAAIPAISASMATRNYQDVRRKTNTILKTGLFFAIPSGIGLTLFAKPIMHFIFTGTSDGGELLMYGSISIIFITLAQLSAGILQGMGRQQVPTRNAIIACLFKVACNLVLLNIKGLHIYAVIHSTTLCYVLYAGLNLLYLKGALQIKYPFKEFFLKPLVNAVVMGMISYGLFKVLMLISPREKLWLMVVIGVAILTYGVLSILTGAIDKKELQKIPFAGKFFA